ncbi:MAG: ketopantoate reductase family protein [Promethearchaeota archaeon]
MRIGIVGAGSIGLLFGGYLANIESDLYSIEIVLFGRKEHVNAIQNNGLLLKNNKETIIIKNIQAFECPEDLERNHLSLKFDFVFLTTKTYDIEPSLRQYEEILRMSDYLVLLQNGIGNEDVAKSFFDENCIIRMITTNGAFKEEAGSVYHTGFGVTKVGFPFQNIMDKPNIDVLKLLKELLCEATLETFIVRDILKDCWEKILINIGINAFGALTRLTNGELLHNESLKELMSKAIKEALVVAEKKGIDLPNKDYIDITYNVANKTHSNKNSMLQDVLKGKKTEIDYINGRIVEYARELNILVPTNELLTALIKGLEASFKNYP